MTTSKQPRILARSGPWILAIALLPACGAPAPSDDGGTTTSATNSSSSGDSGDSGDSTSSTATAETESSTETGEPSPCDVCAEGELCVAVITGDACGFGSGYYIDCVPEPPECGAIPLCDQACVQAICGDDTECMPLCDAIPEIDLWCGRNFWTSPCDPLLQNCPEGEKCVAYASTGGWWDDNKCVSVVGDKSVGETCSYNGPVESTDDCDSSGFCFGAEGEPLEGTCYGFCEVDASCPPDQDCLIANDNSIALCLDSCDTSGPDTCTQPLTCQAMFADPPPGFETLGECRMAP